MHAVLDPWLRFDGKKFVLAERAPKEAQDMYVIYWAKAKKYFEPEQEDK